MPERCLKDSKKLCIPICRLRGVAQQVAMRCPLDPDMFPEEYEAWGHVILQEMGAKSARREIEEHCPRMD